MLTKFICIARSKGLAFCFFMEYFYDVGRIRVKKVEMLECNNLDKTNVARIMLELTVVKNHYDMEEIYANMLYEKTTG